MKQRIITFALWLFYYIEAFAYKSGRGRLDSDGPSDFMAVLASIFAIVFGEFLCYIFWGGSAQNRFKDKEMNKFGCLGLLLIIMAFILLFLMYSN